MDMQAAMDRVADIAARTGIAGIERGTSYGTPALKLKGRFLCRMRDPDTLVVRCALEEKAFLMAADPAIFYETDHYRGYDAVLVRLGAADDATVEGRLRAACALPREKKRR
jgi:hypothetical protein